MDTEPSRLYYIDEGNFPDKKKTCIAETDVLDKGENKQNRFFQPQITGQYQASPTKRDIMAEELFRRRFYGSSSSTNSFFSSDCGSLWIGVDGTLAGAPELTL